LTLDSDLILFFVRRFSPIDELAREGSGGNRESDCGCDLTTTTFGCYKQLWMRLSCRENYL